MGRQLLMLSNNELINQWKNCGLKSLKEFSINKHYTVFFDDKIDGFSNIFNGFSLKKLSKINDQYVNIRMNEIDQLMKNVSNLVETFFINFITNEDDDEIFNNYNNEIKDKIYRKYNEVIMIRNEILMYLKKKSQQNNSKI